jgi:hypothetical protein
MCIVLHMPKRKMHCFNFFFFFVIFNAFLQLLFSLIHRFYPPPPFQKRCIEVSLYYSPIYALVLNIKATKCRMLSDSGL